MGQCDQDGCTTAVTSADIQAAVVVAKMVDVVIVNVAVTSTEGYDRDNLTISPAQDQLVEAVAAANANVVVVVRCPGAVLMPWRDKVKAIIVQFLPGEQAGNALAAVLLGDKDPGGRCPVSFPASENQVQLLNNPAQYPGLSNGKGGFIATYTEELLIGYRYYDQKKLAPGTAARVRTLRY